MMEECDLQDDWSEVISSLSDNYAVMRESNKQAPLMMHLEYKVSFPDT